MRSSSVFCKHRHYCSARSIKISKFEDKVSRIAEAFEKALRQDPMGSSTPRVYILPFTEESCVIMVSHDGGPAILEVSMGVDYEGLITVIEHDRASNASKTRLSPNDYASITALIEEGCAFLKAQQRESVAG